jgi:hypothetical protein
MPVDLNEIVEHSLMLVRHHLQIAGRRGTEPPARRVPADENQIEQGAGGRFVNAMRP